eukprot:7091523-Heterocapsa_arctica.AAC.1
MEEETREELGGTPLAPPNPQVDRNVVEEQAEHPASDDNFSPYSSTHARNEGGGASPVPTPAQKLEQGADPYRSPTKTVNGTPANAPSEPSWGPLHE